jgi:hypothetical protein
MPEPGWLPHEEERKQNGIGDDFAPNWKENRSEDAI